MRYRAFRRKKDGLFYFQFLSESDLVLLNSQSYRDKNSCFNGIRSVLNNAGKPENYVRRKDGEGNHFFILKAANGQEIGQSRRYTALDDLESAIHLFTSEGPDSSSKLPGAPTDEVTPPAKTEESALPEQAKKKESVKKAKSSQKRIYLQEDQVALGNGVVYDTFQSGSNQRYYFVFKDKTGKAILINSNIRGFDTEDDLKNGVQKVIELAPLSTQYETKTAKNGKHYFTIKGTDGKSVAKSSLFFDSKKDMNAVLQLLQTSIPKSKSAKAPSKKSTGKLADEYLPCEVYTGAEGFYTFQNKENEKYYFAYNNAEGKTFLRSEGYKSAKSRDKGIQSVIKNAPQEKRWGTTARDGKYFYFLKAGNNQEIARSCPYDEEESMLAALTWIQGNDSPIGFGSALVGGSLMSAAMLDKEIEQEENPVAAAPLPTEASEPGKPEDVQKAEDIAESEAEDSTLDKAALALGVAGLVSGMGNEEATDEAKTAEQLEAEEKASIAAEVEADKFKAKEAARLAAEEAGTKRKKEEEEAELAAAALVAANLKSQEEARVAEEEKQKRAAAAAATLAASQANASSARADSQESDAKSDKRGRSGWLIPLILGIVLIAALLYFMKSCEGCSGAGKTDDDTKKELQDQNAGGKVDGISGGGKSNSGKDTTKDSLNAGNSSIAGSGSDSSGKDASGNSGTSGDSDENNNSGNDTSGDDGTSADGKGTPKAFGKDGKAFGFSAGSMEDQMANHLSTGGSNLAKTFLADNIKFNKNNDRLRSAARKQLDNIAVLLKAYPEAEIDIYGYINDREDISFKGSKEVTLDDARSKAVYNYLISRGIDKSRLDFFGNGLNDEGGIELKLKT